MGWILKSLIGFTLALLLVVLVWTICLAIKEDKECTSSGGKWVGTGEYYTQTIYVFSGNVMIPVTSTQEEMKCVRGGE
jgi:hypothetical protein